MTQPIPTADAMTADQLAAWFSARGVPEGDVSGLVAENAGKSEAELDALYEQLCGDIA